jgi:hypothetical protein
MDLIATNGGCRLPCWWGITPGKTTWEEARIFLEQFVTQILILSKDVYGVTYHNLPESVSRGAVGATISVQDGIIQEIGTDVYLPLEEVLHIYGQSDEVMIYVDAQSIDPQAPFTISLFYANQGFLANYIGKTNKGEILQICPSAISGDQISWFLWNPALDISFESAGRESLLFTSPSDRRFLKLGDATNMDIQTFYDTYRNTKNKSTCFVMPDPTRD